jgi:hypothetical protein
MQLSILFQPLMPSLDETHVNYDHAFICPVIYYLASNRYFQKIFSFYDWYPPPSILQEGEKAGRNQYHILAFSNVLSIIANDPDLLFIWLLKYYQFKDHPLLLGSFLFSKESEKCKETVLKTINYDPLPSIETRFAGALPFWKELFVWVWQPLQKSALPNAIIMHIASFLTTTTGYLFLKYMIFRKAKRLLLLNLKSSALEMESKSAGLGSMITLFNSIKERKSLSQAVRTELGKREGKPDDPITQALQNCQSRLAPLFSSY